MKTVFKKGMKVYDQLIFPDKEGIVLTTNYIPEKFFDEDDFDENYVHPYPIEVEFGSETMLYTSDGDSGMCGVKTLSIKPYKVVFEGFEQKAPVPTFEDVLDWLDNNENYQTVFEDERTYPSKEICSAFEALRKLIILRDYYNEGWQPDWSKKNKMHFCIRVRNNKITTDNNSDINEFNTVLVFIDYTIRDKFLEEQRELLEIAKPLL